MDRWGTIAAALLAGSVTLLGCGSDDTPPGGQDGSKSEGRSVGITFPKASDPFFLACRRGAEAVVTAHGDKLAALDAGSDPTQTKAVEGLIERKAAFILLSVADPNASVAAVAKANAAGIPVVTFAAAGSGGKTVCSVESDHELAGAFCADYIGWRLGGVGEVAILDHPGVAAARQRIESFKNHAATHFPSITIVDTLLLGHTTDDGTAATTKLLQAHPYVDAIFAIDDARGLAAARAVTAAKNATVFVVGIGGGPEAVAELKKPKSPFAMTVAQFPQEIGRVAAETAYKMLAGETVGHPSITIPVMPVTRDNLGQYPTWAGGMADEIGIPWETKITAPARKD